MDENLKIYNAVRVVPTEAKRSITGGRLKGKTEINPMWRIKTLQIVWSFMESDGTTKCIQQWLEPSGTMRSQPL